MSATRLDEGVKHLLNALDGSGSDAEWRAIEQLRSVVGDALPALLLCRYRVSKRWQVRTSLVYNAIRYARKSPGAVALGVLAITDKSQAVRYRACMLLAYSLELGALPALRAAITSTPESSREDIAAAIHAIETRNEHHFVDRKHTGRMTLTVR